MANKKKFSWLLTIFLAIVGLLLGAVIGVAGGAVYDAIYNPLETALVKRAKANGSKAAGGMSMLVWQAVAAHQIWDGSQYDPKDIEQLVQDAAEEMNRQFSN